MLNLHKERFTPPEVRLQDIYGNFLEFIEKRIEAQGHQAADFRIPKVGEQYANLYGDIKTCQDPLHRDPRIITERKQKLREFHLVESETPGKYVCLLNSAGELSVMHVRHSSAGLSDGSKRAGWIYLNEKGK